MKTYWVASKRHYTVDGRERQMYLPLPYADITGIDPSRIFETQEECEEWCRVMNNRQKEGVKK